MVTGCSGWQAPDRQTWPDSQSPLLLQVAAVSPPEPPDVPPEPAFVELPPAPGNVPGSQLTLPPALGEPPVPALEFVPADAPPASTSSVAPAPSSLLPAR
ncbi:MAG TPA: hypothetical protein VHM25_11890 [Polyangiaceae bacterium]|nr:hypothetical protein [Polyangiaceae bacterium]